jgi:hypothetical protein
MLYIWPGLPQLWFRGSWSGLTVAIITAGLVDIILLSTFGWSELISPGVRNALWVSLGGVWLGSLLFFSGSDPSRPVDVKGAGSDPFSEAVDYYLQGNWFEAERLWSLQLQHDPRDLDARLMLATLLRHTGRWDEAHGQLDRLQRCDGAWKWVLEISRERQLLAEAQRPAESEENDPPQAEPAEAAASRVQAA